MINVLQVALPEIALCALVFNHSVAFLAHQSVARLKTPTPLLSIMGIVPLTFNIAHHPGFRAVVGYYLSLRLQVSNHVGTQLSAHGSSRESRGHGESAQRRAAYRNRRIFSWAYAWKKPG
ncbi:protein of unknown function (plasmid) [Cupriavidus taiwanensis]|uniref:Uncharacterized protein n=1 Tax=Cupriavidus taiwanensis TaxID=164546 RepID=A0A375IVB6_9BURK|nr:protein of unknown function [Cupriavidus taiwanensis]